MNVNFNLPDFELGLPIYKLINEYKILYPYIFINSQDNISSIFGCFRGAIWNGGTVMLSNGIHTLEGIKNLITFYNSINIPLRFTFTNPHILTQGQCEDTFCNLITELGHNGKN